jgi:hypothetical protein
MKITQRDEDTIAGLSSLLIAPCSDDIRSVQDDAHEID